MSRSARAVEQGVGRMLARVEAAVSALYGSRYNPLHHSGAVVCVLLVVLIVTGVYLLVFYRVGNPYESTAAITAQWWGGRWIRSLHRFSTDAALLAIAVHALKMFVQGRSWGPRLLAWISGVLLLLVFTVCGWTGYVLVWDVQAQVLAVEGARLLDVLPILSEPLSRTFSGEVPMSRAFFFMNLFLHVALPIGMGVLLWLHVSRVSRPRLTPPRAVTWGVVGALTIASIAWPIAMAAPADLFRRAGEAPYDLFFSFWLPVAREMSPGAVWLLALVGVLAVLVVPLWTRPRRRQRPPASIVDERLCTGCEQCAKDCPFEAITMLERSDDRGGLVARVDESLCVSCGICAGSCAPMVVGPPGRTGREQLAEVKRFISDKAPGPRDVVLIGCTSGAGGVTALERFADAYILPIRCAGSLHSSVVEYLVRAGAGGVMVVSCPFHDCRNREGAKWLEARLYHEREAELKARVDRRRVRWVEAGAGERSRVVHELRAFRESISAEAHYAEAEIDLVTLCERAAEEVGP